MLKSARRIGSALPAALTVLLAACPNPAVEEPMIDPITGLIYPVAPGPLDGVLTVLARPTLAWSAPAGAAGYELQCSVDDAAALAASAPIPVAGNSYALLEDLPYLDAPVPVSWRVRAKNSAGVWGAWSNVFAFRYSPVPDGFSAVPGAAGTSDTTPLVDWDDIHGAAAYRIQVCRTADRDTAPGSIADESGLASSSYALATAVPKGSKRSWRLACATEGGAWTAFSPWREFEVVWAYAVTTATPAETFDQSPELEWSDVLDGVDADPCAWQIAVFRDAAAVASSKLTGGNKTSATSALSWATLGFEIMELDSVPLYWSVRPVNSEGVPGTAWFDFSTQAKYPTLAVVSPADGEVVEGEVVLDWEAVSGALNYDLVVGTDHDAVELASAPTDAGLTADELALVGLPVGAARWWKFRVRNDDGTVHGWSAVNGFTTPWSVAYTGLSPADGFVTFDTSPTLDWDDVAGAAGYKLAAGLTLEAAQDAQADPAGCTSVAVSTFTHPGIGYDSTYYWSVVAVNSEGTLAPSWSPIRSFTVSTAFTPVQTYPADGAVIADATPTLECEPIDGAAGYVFTVSGSATDWGAAVMYDSALPAFTLDAIPSGQSRWWKVYAYGPFGDKSLSSPVRSFTVE